LEQPIAVIQTEFAFFDSLTVALDAAVAKYL
jgi:hypothetical protein